MAKSHYETLGIPVKSSQQEIRSAYRKIVLLHHPDRSSALESKEIFLAATEAYDILSDPGKRLYYDANLKQEQIKAEQDRLKAYAAARQSGTAGKAPEPDAVPKTGGAASSANLKPAKGSVTVDVTRLTMLFSRAQYGEAEKLAKKILDTDPRQPIPYAVLGDLSRQRGELKVAARMYAYAVQMDPSNSLYQQRHEELLGAVQPVQSTVKSPLSNGMQVFAPMVGAIFILMSCTVIVFSRESALFTGIPPISTWTFELLALLFLSGVAIGASFSVGQLTDRFATVTKTSLGRPSPYVALSIIAAVQFWFSAVLYLLLGAVRRAFNYSTTWLVSATAIATMLFAAACQVATEGPSSWQTLLWGGNVIYLGSVIGWMVADSLQN